MRKWKQLVAALLLTAFFIGLGLLDGALLPADNSEIGEAEITTAAIAKFPEIRIKKPVRNEEGDLIGCVGKGDGCVIVVMSVGGTKHEALIDLERGDFVLR